MTNTLSIDKDFSVMTQRVGLGMAAFLGNGDAATGWNEAERAALQTMIAARQPILDFGFSRVNVDGSQRRFRVSGDA
jgi:hypothetical protein